MNKPVQLVVKILSGAVIAAAAVFVLIILLIIAVVFGRMAVNNSYYAKAEKIYRKEKESFQIILDNMQQLNCDDGILYVNIEWDSSDNKAVCEQLRYLREKYKGKSEFPKHLSEEYNPVFYYVYGEYDEKGLAYIEIPVYYRALNTQGDYDNPDKLLYYISFCRLCSEGSCGRHDYYEPSEEGWFVKTKKGYAG